MIKNQYLERFLARAQICIFGLFFLLVPVASQALTSNDPNAEQWAYTHVGINKAWDYTTGSSNVVVAVIDNGFDTFHPDLFGNAWKNIDEIADNGIDDDRNGYIDDVWGWNFVIEDTNYDGYISDEESKGNNDPRPDPSDLTDSGRNSGIFNHGTAVAGIIGAVGNNKKDGVGINWKAKLMNIKVIDNTGYGSLDKLDEAIRYAVDNGAHIINISMVGSEDSTDVASAISYAYDRGVSVIAAAGNNMLSLDDYPMSPVCLDAGNSIEKVLGVSAITEDHHLARFSNYGSNCVDITAPGVNIQSTLRYSPTNGFPDTYGGDWDGTSFSTPMVSGAAALLKSIQPTWKPLDIFTALTKTVQHTPGQDEVVYAELFGAGLLQIDKAVQYAVEWKGSGTETREPTIIIEDEPTQVIESSERIITISQDGKRQEKYTDFSSEDFISKSALQNLDDITSYEYNGQKYFVTVASVNKKTVVTFYNKDFALIRQWETDKRGPFEILVGDIFEGIGQEVVLAPKYGGTKQVFLLFSLNGVEKGEYLSESNNAGVSVAIDNGNLVALYSEDRNLKISKFDQKLESISEMDINYPGVAGKLAVGDINSDLQNEYIVGAVSGDVPWLSYYDNAGILLRQFYAYDAGYRGGLDLSIMDFDNNGEDDVIVALESGLQPVRVWNSRSGKLASWWPFGKDNVQTLKVLVY